MVLSLKHSLDNRYKERVNTAYISGSTRINFFLFPLKMSFTAAYIQTLLVFNLHVTLDANISPVKNVKTYICYYCSYSPDQYNRQNIAFKEVERVFFSKVSGRSQLQPNSMQSTVREGP